MAHPPSSPSNSPQATWQSPQAPWPSPQAPWHIGVDIGGTFTDVVLADERGDLHSIKSPSVPGDPAEGLIAGLRMLAVHCGMTIEALREKLRATGLTLPEDPSQWPTSATSRIADALKTGA